MRNLPAGHLSYIRSPRNAACQQRFGRVLRSQEIFEHDSDELHAPLRHLASFRGIGSDAYAVNCVWLVQREGAAPAVD